MRNLLLISLALALSGCATSNSKKYCETPVRDLTQDWHSRFYWCLPKGYVPLIDGQVTPQIAPSTWSNSTAAPLMLYTEQESLQHKVRVVSQESVVSNQNNPSAQSPQTSMNKFETGERKVAAVIGTEPVKKDNKKIKMHDINFTRHNLDTDLVSKELDWTVSILKHIIKPERVLKLQGCRKDSEIESLVLGRALAVRKALVEKGVENKIIILTDQNCTTDRKVKVFMS